MMGPRPTLLFLLLLGFMTISAQPQVNTNKKNGGYFFTIRKFCRADTVENQFCSNTCWTYSTNSFLESEILRLGKGSIRISEGFNVRNVYIQKAENYLRYRGVSNFGSGGEPHDVISTMRESGIVPEEVYSSILPTEDIPEELEMDAVLKAMLDAMLKLPAGKLNPNWRSAFIGALDGYMGKPPEKFIFKGKTFTPVSFANWLGINPDDYIEITSFTHHPFYHAFILEVPDNWSHGSTYNVPIEDLKAIVDSALIKNFSVVWCTGVKEKGFAYKNGLAIVPDKELIEKRGGEDSIFIVPGKEKVITQEIRQKAFDNLTTTDDHDIQILGIADDQNGTPYYIVKNSWGSQSNDIGGYFYCSMPYFMYKTTVIMVNKHALPKEIAAKLGIKL